MSTPGSAASAATSSLPAYMLMQLQKLEAAGGGVDTEARAALQKLEAAMAAPQLRNSDGAAIAGAAGTPSGHDVVEMNEAQLSEYLEKLESELDSVEKATKGLQSVEAKVLMAESAALLLGTTEPPKREGAGGDQEL